MQDHSFTKLIRKTADRFEALIQEYCTHLQEIPTEDFGWCNHRWSSYQFRLAHVERFEQPNFSVLHTVIFPHVIDPSHIFGFDIIASDHKATGLFFDFSPTILPTVPLSTKTWNEPRERPEWGDIFSPHWIACRPNYQEADLISEMACAYLRTHLKTLGTKSTPRVHDVIQAQNHYSLQQRKNTHTTRVIIKLLGEEKGNHFIENILFPTI